VNGSRLGSAELFADSQFRVAPKLPGGPDRLKDLIRSSLRRPAGAEAFRNDIRRARMCLLLLCLKTLQGHGGTKLLTKRTCLLQGICWRASGNSWWHACRAGRLTGTLLLSEFESKPAPGQALLQAMGPRKF
jgi:hypothetical protein